MSYCTPYIGIPCWNVEVGCVMVLSNNNNHPPVDFKTVCHCVWGIVHWWDERRCREQNNQIFPSSLMMCLCDCEGKNWERKYPCQSRNEMVTRYSQVRKRKVLEPNSQWAAVLQEYSALHRTCMRKVGNVTRDFDDGTGNSRTGCKFLVVNLQHVGIGNKVVLLTSAVLYAILTQRVLLIPSHSYIPQTMCEPFLGSSWVLDERFPLPVPGWEDTLVGRWTGWESPVWKSTAFFEKGKEQF